MTERPSTLISEPPEDFEVELGVKGYREMLEEAGTSPVEEVDARITEVRRLLEAEITPERGSRRAALKVFLYHYNRHSTQPLEALCRLAASDLLTVIRGSTDASWFVEWTATYGLPSTDAMLSQARETLLNYLAAKRGGTDQPLAWDYGPRVYSMVVGDRPPWRFDELVVRLDGWCPALERAADVRKRFRLQLKEAADWYIKEAEQYLQRRGSVEANLDRRQVFQLRLLAMYQAKREVSIPALAKKARLEPRQARYALHRAAGLVGLPTARLNHAPGTPKKR